METQTKYECSGCGRMHNSAGEAGKCFSMHDCCANIKDKKKGFVNGIVYGLVPHTFCILFIIGSILGVTLFTSAFKPFLMNKNFFYILIGLSFGFATLSALFYLKRNNCLCTSGAGKRWKFLSILYATTIGINLLFFFVIFPAVANIGAVSGKAVSDSSLSQLVLNVDIPCSGHAPLIISELKTLDGVKDVQYDSGNFNVKYDSSETTKEEILKLKIFEEYTAKEV
jgi:copper chaperone CopZ